MSSSVVVNYQGADHRANSDASYAPARPRQAPLELKIRICTFHFSNTGTSSKPSLVTLRSSRKQRFRCFFAIILSLSVWCSATTASAQAGRPAKSSTLPRPAVAASLAATLTADFRAAIVNKPLRDALQSIAGPAKVNVWLDRQIDPASPASCDPNSSTVFQAIQSLASSCALQIAVADNVVLVGRESWVVQSAAAVMNDTQTQVEANITWPELTTPTQAATAAGASDQSAPLPHDLWPAVCWYSLRPSVAQILVAAQFDKWPTNVPAAGYEPLVVPLAIAATYPTGTHAVDMQAAVKAIDTNAKFKSADKKLLVTCSPTAHQAAINHWLTNSQRPVLRPFDLDKPNLTLTIEHARAEAVFTQLAAAAGRKLLIDPGAQQACQTMIALSAKNSSMRQLIEQIATQADVRIEWTDTQLDVKPSPK